MKTKIGKLNFDPHLIKLRPINEHVVSRYRQAYRAGEDMGHPIIDRKTMTIVSGAHRVMALTQEYGKNHAIDVQTRTFKSRAELLECFASENVSHGLPLTGYSRRAIAHEMAKEGMTKEEIADTFRVSVQRLEKWGEFEVAVIGRGRLPRKAGPDIDEATLTPEQYEEHRTADVGLPVKAMADQLTRWARNGYLDNLSDVDREAIIVMIEAVSEVI